MSNPINIKKLIITGANGFIGNTLMKYYQAKGVEVIGVDIRGNGNDIIEGNIATPEQWAEHFDNCDVVVHMAALVSNATPEKLMWDVNVQATQNLIRFAAQKGVKRFIHFSSIMAYGLMAEGELTEDRPVHAYNISYVNTKVASEHTVLREHIRSNIDIVIIRPGDVYGPHCRVWVEIPLQLIKSFNFILPANGKACFRPIFIDDLISGIAAAIEKEQASGEIFNLTPSGYVTTKEFFSYHHRWLGRKIICLPTPLAKLLATISFNFFKLIGKRSEGSPESVLMLTSKAWYSNKKAKQLLDWEPKISLEEGMQITQDWAKENKLI